MIFNPNGEDSGLADVSAAEQLRVMRYALYEANARLEALEIAAQPKEVTIHFKTWTGETVVLKLPLQNVPRVGDVIDYNFDSGEFDGAVASMRVVQIRHSCHPSKPPLTVICETASPS
jgi:hypothetical protein